MKPKNINSFMSVVLILSFLLTLCACSEQKTPEILSSATPRPTLEATKPLTPTLSPTPHPTLIPDPELIAACQPVVDGIYELILNLEIPDHFDARRDQEVARSGNEFDVNSYFAVLTDIAMESGYTLDYVYSTALGNGYPVLYARANNAGRYTTYSEYKQAMSQSGTEEEFFWSRLGDMMRDDTPADFDLPEKEYMQLHQGYLSHVTAKDAKNGYFQLVLLSMLGDQFYLQWHANYDDEIVICDQSGFQKIVDGIEKTILEGDPSSEWYAKKINEINQMREGMVDVDLAPSVIIGDKTVEVQLTYFSKWGGFFRETYLVSRIAPHVIIRTNRTNLLKYDCGIQF